LENEGRAGVFRIDCVLFRCVLWGAGYSVADSKSGLSFVWMGGGMDLFVSIPMSLGAAKMNNFTATLRRP